MAKTFTIRPQAEQDLENIFYYGLLNFGEQQANHFLVHLKISLENLCLFKIGTACFDIFPNLYRHIVGNYTIFFFRNPNTIEIVRILHSSQDVHSHFVLS